MSKPRTTPFYFTGKFFTVLGIVLTWRGIWYVLDELDKLVFGGSHIWIAIAGIIIGIIILYWPDKKLDEI